MVYQSIFSRSVQNSGISYSLGIIGAVIAASIMLSLLIPKRRAAVGRRPGDVMPQPDEAVGGHGPKTVSRSESSKSSAPPR